MRAPSAPWQRFQDAMLKVDFDRVGLAVDQQTCFARILIQSRSPLVRWLSVHCACHLVAPHWLPRLTARRSSSKSDGVIAPCFLDRKSTRLNSSHLGISYAVF